MYHSWDRKPPKTLKRKLKKIFFETPVEILMGVAILGSIFGGLSYRHNAAKSGEIPLAFSEIEQIEKDHKAQDMEVPPLTRFYASNNDVAMKVFESNNIALKTGKSHEVFAHELQTRVDASLKKHKLISEYAAEMPQDARAALQSVDKLSQAARKLPPVQDAFNKAWTADHDDVYHTEFYTTTSCDSKNNCTTQLHSRQVYDYTWHTFTYNAKYGEQASRLLNEYLARHPDMKLDEVLKLARATSAENETAMRESMKRQLEGRTPSQEEYLKFANTWAEGSNYLKYKGAAEQNHNALEGLSPQWNAHKNTSKSVRYKTYRHHDSGPKEFQTAEQTAMRIKELREAAHGVIDGMHFSGQKVPELSQKIKDYVDVVLHAKHGDPDALRADIMKTARGIYDQNYENGFDVHPFKWLDVILLTVLGMAVGGGIGYGADRLLHGKRREWYELTEDADNGEASPLPSTPRENSFPGGTIDLNDMFRKAQERERKAAPVPPQDVPTPEVKKEEPAVITAPIPANDPESPVVVPDDRSVDKVWKQKYRKVMPP